MNRVVRNYCIWNEVGNVVIVVERLPKQDLRFGYELNRKERG